MTATSTDATVTSMTLQPYLTETGTIFDPASLGDNLTVSLIAPGSFTITLVGAPGAGLQPRWDVRDTVQADADHRQVAECGWCHHRHEPAEPAHHHPYVSIVSN